MKTKIKHLRYKLRLVEHMDQLEGKGDARVIEYPDHIGLIWICPNCGKETATARGHKHIFNRKTNSLHPSIVHDITLGGCGWHGWLKNGIFYN